jgi:hypothetical protein
MRHSRRISTQQPSPQGVSIDYRSLQHLSHSMHLEIKDLDARLQAIRSLVHELPQAHFDLLKRLSEHFYESAHRFHFSLNQSDLNDRVTESESINQMSEGALAIVLHPNLLQAPDFGVTMRNMGAASTLVRTLISQVCNASRSRECSTYDEFSSTSFSMIQSRPRTTMLVFPTRLSSKRTKRKRRPRIPIRLRRARAALRTRASLWPCDECRRAFGSLCSGVLMGLLFGQ